MRPPPIPDQRMLMPCKSCNTWISKKAFECPSCGNPISERPTARLARGCGMLVVGVVGLIVALMMAGALGIR
jgi:uncharacterized paraquat-inducible protein A